MKKLLMIVFIIGFVFVGNALADEFINGRCDITYIRIWEAQPCGTEGCGQNIVPCDVRFVFTTPNQQVYSLSGIAYGDALNLAILKAGNFGENISCRLKYRFVPGFDIEIVNVDFDRLPFFDN